MRGLSLHVTLVPAPPGPEPLGTHRAGHSRYLHDGVNCGFVHILLRRLLDQAGGHKTESSEQVMSVGAGGDARRVCRSQGQKSAFLEEPNHSDHGV